MAQRSRDPGRLGLHDDGPDAGSSFTWVCRYYRYLHPGEDLDPCIAPATKHVMLPTTGEVFAICDRHFQDEAETRQLRVIREF